MAVAKVSMSDPLTKSLEGELSDIASVQNAIIADFSFFDEWEDKYRFLIDLGKTLPDFPAELKTDANRLRGCQSHVWFLGEKTPKGQLVIKATSDAAIVRGLIALLLKIYSGRSPQAILKTKPVFIETIGLSSHLSPTRSNGLNAMVKEIHKQALMAVAD